MLTVKNLDVTLNVPLIKDVNITLCPGEVVGLVAANGTGKSTLLQSLTGLRDVKTGEAFIEEHGRRLSFVAFKQRVFYFESSNWFNPSLTGKDYLVMINSQWGAHPECISRAIDFWQLADFIDKPIKKYSLGMKQKLLLSLYEASGADYWFLDEPTLALDRQSVGKLQEIILNAKSRGKMVFFSAHENELFFEICDYIYRIETEKLIREEIK